METLFYEGAFPMTRKRKYTRAGPGRPSEYGEPLHLLSMNVPQSKFLEFDEMCKKLGISRPKGFIMLLEHRNQNVMELMAKVQQLEKILAEKDELIESLIKEDKRKEKVIERLQEELEKRDRKIEKLKKEIEKLKIELLSKKERDVIELKQEIYALLDKHKELKLIDLLQKLGYEGDYKKHAKAFLKRWFVQQGYSFVSEELGLVIKPVHGFGELAWKVRKLEVVQ